MSFCVLSWYNNCNDASLLGSVVDLLYCSLPSIFNDCCVLSPDLSDALIRHYPMSFSFITLFTTQPDQF